MTMKSAEAFMQKMLTEEKFAKHVISCNDAEERNVFAKKSGYDFSPDEIQMAWKDISRQQLKLKPKFNVGGITPLRGIMWTCCWYEPFE